MRREINEPKHWRSQAAGSATQGSCWAGRRHSHSATALPAEAVDAAFASESVTVEAVRGSRRDMQAAETTSEKSSPGRPDLISSLSTQLTMLEAQHEQLSRLLAQAQNR
ncbi:MAG: hypothetical protein GXP26_12520 [Planctomycetes bacterium]|nr:hypothetical protein [Planctomycetota bacterium]